MEPSTTNEIVSDELIKELTTKVSEKISKDVVSAIDSAQREIIDCWLDEYVKNFEDQMFNRVFKFIKGDKWSQFKDKYDAAELRAQIYREHKEEIDKQLTEQIVEENLHKYLNHFFAGTHQTGWRYLPMAEKLAAWVLDRIKDSEQLRTSIETEAIRRAERAENMVEQLKERLNRISDIA